jgi:aspartate/methionine/tyrosine aminotransferase
MTFRKIDYLEWARTHMGRVRIDLAKSNVKAVTKEELGLTLDAIELACADEEGVVELRELLAKRYGLGRANVLVTSGATMGIFLACAAVIQPGEQVILESPNYEPLYRAAAQKGAEIKMLERRFERGFQVEMEELERKVGRGTRAILLTNLHNPSGVATSPEKMMSIGQIARDYGATVIVSEVYLDNAFTPDVRPAATYGPNMVSIGSLSKVYGLGGLRVGWLAGPEAVIRKARLALDYIECDLPAPSETIALAALRKAPELIQRCRQIVRRNVAVVEEWVARREDVSWVKPDGGTVCMIKLPAGVEGQELSNLLREKYSTLVVPGEFFWIRGFVRVSCGMDEEVLRAGLKNLGKAIDQVKKESGI